MIFVTKRQTLMSNAIWSLSLARMATVPKWYKDNNAKIAGRLATLTANRESEEIYREKCGESGRETGRESRKKCDLYPTGVRQAREQAGVNRLAWAVLAVHRSRAFVQRDLSEADAHLFDCDFRLENKISAVCPIWRLFRFQASQHAEDGNCQTMRRVFKRSVTEVL